MAAAAPPGGFALPAVSALPPAVQRYAATGTPPNPIRRDLVTVTNQIPRWAYAVIAVGSAWFAFRAWKQRARESEQKPRREATEKLTG